MRSGAEGGWPPSCFWLLTHAAPGCSQTSPRLSPALTLFPLRPPPVCLQSFQDELLALCGRAHDAADVYRAIEAVHAAGVPSWSLDLMSGLPQLTQELWQRSLEQALDAAPHHISTYDLQVKDGCGCWEVVVPRSCHLPCAVNAACFAAGPNGPVGPAPLTRCHPPPRPPVRLIPGRWRSTRHLPSGTGQERRRSPATTRRRTCTAKRATRCGALVGAQQNTYVYCVSLVSPARQHRGLPWLSVWDPVLPPPPMPWHRSSRAPSPVPTSPSPACMPPIQGLSITRSATMRCRATAAATTWCTGRGALSTGWAWGLPPTCRHVGAQLAAPPT